MNDEIITIDKDNLPTWEELHYDVEKAFINNKYKKLLNKAPSESWLKKNKMANNSKYLPIDKTEFLLDAIFQEWKIEVLREGVMFQSVYVTVRVHYNHPITGEWMFHDGVGAKDLQKDADTVFSIETVKAAAVQMALPTAKSLAIKDACDHLGKVFGRDVNRKDTIEYQSAYKEIDKSEERILKLIEACKTRGQLMKFKDECKTQDSKTAYDNKWRDLQ